ELQGDRTVEEEHVAPPRGRAVNDAEALDIVPWIRGRGHLDRAAHDAEHQRPGRVAFRPVEELAHQARLQPLEDRSAGAAFHRGVDVLLDPLDEILRPQADDVSLLRALNHPIRTPSYGPQIALRQAGPRHRCHGHGKGLWYPSQTISRIQMTYTQRHNIELVPGRALRYDATGSYSIARCDSLRDSLNLVGAMITWG